MNLWIFPSRILRNAPAFFFSLYGAFSAYCADAPAHSAIDSHGVLILDGKKIFPIGFTMPPPPDGRTPEGKDAIAELREAGANFLRTGPMGTAWNNDALELEQRYQDAAARNQMHCLVNLRELGSLDEKASAR